MINNKGEIFIVGVGRSGTSLLQSMLASHSELSFLPETAYIRNFIVKSKLKKILSKKNIENALKVITEDKTLSRIDFDFKKCLSNNKDNIDLYCYKEMQYKAMKSSGKSRYGDKDPRLIEYIPTIRHYFPESYVVNIVRDPRDILVSKKKAAWSAGRSTILYTFANRVQLRMARLLGKKLFGERYIEVIYEELIKHPEKQLKILCSKLNLKYEGKLLQFENQAKKLVSEAELGWKKETLGPLLVNNTNKWKNKLNKYEIALTEKCCNDAFSIGCYKKSQVFKTLPFLLKMKTNFSHMLILVLAPIYCFFRVLNQKKYI